jgi:hypothetical protein
MTNLEKKKLFPFKIQTLISFKLKISKITLSGNSYVHSN